MYRVVTKRIDYRGKRIIEHGPWFVSHHDAEYWADILRDCGYHSEVQSQHGGGEAHANEDSQLRDALSSMA